MAASVYATPPPDHLSDDETVLSDVSNSSQLSSPKSMRMLEQSLAEIVLPCGSGTNIPSEEVNNSTGILMNDVDDGEGDNEIDQQMDLTQTLAMNISKTRHINPELMTKSLASYIDSNGISSMDSVPDLCKKRRKQSTPLRISATTIPISAGTLTNRAPVTEMQDNEDNNTSKSEVKNPNQKAQSSRTFLSDISQLQAKTKLISDYAQNGFLAVVKNELINQMGPLTMLEKGNDCTGSGNNDRLERAESAEKFPNSFSCDQCGLKLNSEIEVGLHIVQEHTPKQFKLDNKLLNALEKPEEAVSLNIADLKDQKHNILTNTKPEEWITLNTLPFQFPPEATAMLTPSHYLPQLPLLGVAPFTPDTVNRSNGPPLRIFNPEAYCNLCNKEFCNKYFLKTHRANKHNLYEPSAIEMTNANLPNLSQISQVLQLQQKQQQDQLPNLITLNQTQANNQSHAQTLAKVNCAVSLAAGSTTTTTATSPIQQDTSIFCDVCLKRFTNIFAMRRHRSKAHENPTTGDSTIKADKSNMIFPEGFQEDFSIEQEDTAFTPQPQKLSPESISQAREANFSAEKLKRLGVTNPEAFCELCCKEYCNKYFLRTHKIKRHGVFIAPDETHVNKDEEEVASTPTSAAAVASAWKFLQNRSLNLILGTADQMSHQLVVYDQERNFIGKLSTESSDDKNNGKMSFNHDDTDGEEANSSDEQEQQRSQQLHDGDLQKLQTMIMQLNDMSNRRPVDCEICGREQDNQIALRNHMVMDHPSLVEKNDEDKMQGSSNYLQAIDIQKCKLCDKEFLTSFDMSQHIFEMHGMQSASPLREGFITPERPINSENMVSPVITQQINSERRPYTITPTSSYCEICNKELCNKYFMKTHMQRMHNIEIENGAQIGGVVCNICNKELCSKYFLRVHKHNTHGIVDDGSPLPQSRQRGEQSEPDSVFSAAIDASLSPKEGSDTGNRNSLNSQEVCPVCNRRFRGAKLRMHLINDHGKAGSDMLRDLEQRSTTNTPKLSSNPPLKIPNRAFALSAIDTDLINKHATSGVIETSSNVSQNDETVTSTSTSSRSKEYQCALCPYTTTSLTFLYIHERSHVLLDNHLESVVSNAVDLQHIERLRPSASNISGNGVSTSTLETTTLTLATTPVNTPMTLPETKKNRSHSEKKAEKHPSVQKVKSGRETPLPEQQTILNEMTSVIRPTSYAIPQVIENGMIMQSFFMEPIIADSNNEDIEINRSRFVSSLVLLPVRENVSERVVVSFSLTPA